MIATEFEQSSIDAALAPLLPGDTDLQGSLSAERAERLAAGWHELTQRGFEIEVGTDELKVQHPKQGFAVAIQLSRPDDLGELRSLFASLRRHFGSSRERLLPWLFLPGTAVTVPYKHLRAIIAECQQLRQLRERSA